MKRNVALLLLALLLAGCVYLSYAEKGDSRQWPASGVSSIVASTQNGAVAVAARPESLARARIAKRCNGWTKGEAEGHLDDIVVTDNVGSGRLTLTADMPDLNTRACRADLDITLPETVSVNVSSSNGAMNVTGMIRGVEAHTSNGPITVESVRGTINLHSSNGSVMMANSIGPATVQTSNGAVTLSNHLGSANVHTSNGRIDASIVALASGEAATLRTSSGKVALDLPSNQSFSFDAVTSNGEVKVTGYSVNYQINEKTHKSGTVGSGPYAQVTINSSNGSVEIKSR
jgi:hypothetical protein